MRKRFLACRLASLCLALCLCCLSGCGKAPAPEPESAARELVWAADTPGLNDLMFFIIYQTLQTAMEETEEKDPLYSVIFQILDTEALEQIKAEGTTVYDAKTTHAERGDLTENFGYAQLTAGQIQTLTENEAVQYMFLALPPRTAGYSSKIEHEIVSLLEYEQPEMVSVQVTLNSEEIEPEKMNNEILILCGKMSCAKEAITYCQDGFTAALTETQLNILAAQRTVSAISYFDDGTDTTQAYYITKID